MNQIFYSLIIGLFIALLFFNLYFRIKVLRFYKTLVKNRIEFGAIHIFNKSRMAKEILPRYPQFKNDIEGFAQHMRLSLGVAVLIVILISILGGFLHLNRN